MAILSSFLNSYKNFMETNSHPATKNWFLMGSPVPLIMILVTYVYFCKSAGPRFMRDRKPYDLRKVIVVYNIIQVLLSVYIVYVGTPYWLGGHYKFSCEPVGNIHIIQSTVWLYFMCKIIELLDTVFFILRKKYNQVSYLHMYHHTLMPICGWIGSNFLPGGHGTLLGYINSFIHIIMYVYYLVSSMGPQYQKYLWWKKYLTSMQLVQFLVIFIHNFQVMFRSCDYPKFINFLLATQAAYFLYLFGKFYYNSYIKGKNKSYSSEKQNGFASGKKAVELSNGIKLNGYSNGYVNVCLPNVIQNGKIKET